ncbi:MAG: hypothetical protein V1789_01145 [PVC group bacterium]
MKIFFSGLLLCAFILALPAGSRGTDELLGAPPTYINVTFTSGSRPLPGVTAVLVDGSNMEWKQVSNPEGEVRFVFEAESGMAFLTFWRGDMVPVYKKVFEYNAGNHYNYTLTLNE